MGTEGARESQPSRRKTMPDSTGKIAAAVSLEKVKGDVVTQTLNKLNSPSYKSKSKKAGFSAQGAMSDTYNFSRSVLSAAYQDKGSIIDSIR
jgi:hypothetical protein